MPEIPTLVAMLKAGVHFGHQTSHWHPKMAPFIFGVRNGFHIINIEETQKKLKEAIEFVKEIASKGGVVLFIGTKKQAQDIVKKYAQECKMPYINERWLGGTFTNFVVIKKLVKKFKNIKEKRDLGKWEKYTKKERLEFEKEVARLEEILSGIENLEKIPEAIFILDAKQEATALKEAKKKKVTVIAICDTNVNPGDIDYIIPANDNAAKSLELITSLIAEAIKEGHKLKEAKEIKVDLRGEKKEGNK